jgi:hypothetical protein
MTGIKLNNDSSHWVIIVNRVALIKQLQGCVFFDKINSQQMFLIAAVEKERL